MNSRPDSVYNILVILGPTAAGKTRLAAKVASVIGGEIISADSRQVYRGMDIGTGKDLGDYQVDGQAIPYHLIDILPPAKEFDVFTYQKLFYRTFLQLRQKGTVPIMAGGTGLYIDAVLRGYRMREVPENPGLRNELAGEDWTALTRRLRDLRPRLHNTTDLTDRARLIRALEIAEFELSRGVESGLEQPEIRAFVIGIHWERGILRRRITVRLEQRLAGGLIDEVERLLASGIGHERLETLGLEYRYVSRYLRGRLSREDMQRELNIRIHQFAKRQLTWFRRMERQGLKIHWIEGGDDASAMRLIRQSMGIDISFKTPLPDRPS